MGTVLKNWLPDFKIENIIKTKEILKWVGELKMKI